MAEPAIRVDNVGKRYRLTGERGGYRTMRETITDAVRAPLRRLRGAPAQDFWALSGVSFDVRPGEVVGIIGRNGAGKSTLLKILSRITAPTTGRIDIDGRVGSLLEVGTGFHPELTGRENVFLNGAILGMSRREVAAKFDEIVAFAEVSKFIDTPVKRYSSGMYVRLAFAVAAHLEPEILILDEVLSVGDIAFQAKCLSHMSELSRSGVSVLLVTHSLISLRDFCARGVYLVDGSVVADGPVDRVIDIYQSRLRGPSVASQPSQGGLTLAAVRINGQDAASKVTLSGSDPVVVETTVTTTTRLRELYYNVTVCNQSGLELVHVRNDVTAGTFDLATGRYKLLAHLSNLPLASGAYTLTVRLVSLSADAPLLLDSEPYPVEVNTVGLPSSLVSPPHEFRLAAA